MKLFLGRVVLSTSCLIVMSAIAACTHEIPAEKGVCGGSTSRLTLSGNTFKGPGESGGLVSFNYEVSVYAVGDGSGPAPTEPPGAACGPGAIVAGGGPFDLKSGRYRVCRTMTTCICDDITLGGGAANYDWAAGPGGGVTSVSGCATKN